MNFSKRFIILVLLFAVSMLSINVIRSWIYLSKKGEVIVQIQNQLNQAREKNEDLKRQLAKVESQAYIEREARNKLNLGKEGEITLLLPSISPVIEPSPTSVDTSPNWQKWARLFF